MGILLAGMRFKSWVSNKDGEVVRSGFQRKSPMARDFIFRVRRFLVVPFFFFFFLASEKIPKKKKASCNRMQNAKFCLLSPVRPHQQEDWGRRGVCGLSAKQGRELLINMLQLLLGCYSLAKEGGRAF